jgi:hypothetical protein
MAVVPADIHLSWVSVTLRLVGRIGVIAVLSVAAGIAVSWPDELYRFWTFSYVRWWDGGFLQRILGLSPGWLLGSLMLHEISREKDLFRVSSVFAWLWLFLHCFMFICHILLSVGNHREIWILGFVSDAARGWLHCKELGFLRPCITCNYKTFDTIIVHYSYGAGSKWHN